MALSNRERVGKGLELLGAGLAPFVERHMSAARGADWVAEFARRDAKQGIERVYSTDDPRFLLRALTEEWRVFTDSLSRVEQAFASELRDVGNRYAHEFGKSSFNEADAQRALDTMVRLLRATGAVAQADQVQGMLEDFQLTTFERRTRRVARDSVVVSGLGQADGTSLKPWRELITPHKDVRQGNFNASQFAADLYNVAHGKGTAEYTDPKEFFRRTYLTEGLADLLSRAVRRISGDANASPVINLQTNFGGGKTHSMLALYHICSGTPLHEYPQQVQELLEGTDLARLGPDQVKRVVLVGHHLEPSGSTKPDGTRINTMWGELAYQLGGARAFAAVQEADRTKTNPGTRLQELIAEHAPCLILIDEWVAYARQLYDDDSLAGGTFDTQFTFAQTLTEAVKAVPGAMLAVSIPASDVGADNADQGFVEEVGGTNGQEALKRLQNVVRRVADPWKAATAKESYEIVRRRLFEEPSGDARTAIAAVARQFTKFYFDHHGEFPPECLEPSYEADMRAAYPIHPELFDRLYHDWSSLQKFQRTRGVLALMANVIRTLWDNDDPSPMIMPGTVPLSVPLVGGQLSQYLEDAWLPVIQTDVDDTNEDFRATSMKIDKERTVYGRRSVTKRLARTIFIGSAPTLRGANRGIDKRRVWLGTAVPGDTTGHLGDALHLLSDRASYLYTEGDRYWFDTQQSVSRSAKEIADRYLNQPEEVYAILVGRIRDAAAGQQGKFYFVGPTCPEETDGILDQDRARLVILHPRYAHQRKQTESEAMGFARKALRSRGPSQRRNANMLVFLAPDLSKLGDLTEATCEFLAWRDISGRKDDMNLSQSQQRLVDDRRKRANQAVDLRIKETYIWTLYPSQPNGARPAEMREARTDGPDSLVERASAWLHQNGLLADRHAPANIRAAIDRHLSNVWKEKGHITVGELWDLYAKYNYMPRLRDRTVLVAGIAEVLQLSTWELEGFALATGFENGRYIGLAVPLAESFFDVIDSTLLVVPERALAQRARETAASASGGPTGQDAGTGDQPGGGTSGGTSPSDDSRAERRLTLFYGRTTINGEKYGRALKDLQLEILPHLADPDTELEITVEIKARRTAGFPDDKRRIVSENAQVLKFEQADFES